MDIKDYWQKVRTLESQLDNPTHLVSLKNPAQVVATDPESAAICVTKGSHRKATPSETESHLKSEETKRLAAIEKLSRLFRRCRIRL